jgi:hypothetical protein
MGKGERTGGKGEQGGPDCLLRILAVLVFLTALGGLALHQCARYQEVVVSLPITLDFLEELQSALTAYNTGSDSREYPIGEFDFRKLREILSDHYRGEADEGYSNLRRFHYRSNDGTAYTITAELAVKKETILTVTPDGIE